MIFGYLCGFSLVSKSKVRYVYVKETEMSGDDRKRNKITGQNPG